MHNPATNLTKFTSSRPFSGAGDAVRNIFELRTDLALMSNSVPRGVLFNVMGGLCRGSVTPRARGG